MSVLFRLWSQIFWMFCSYLFVYRGLDFQENLITTCVISRFRFWKSTKKNKQLKQDFDLDVSTVGWIIKTIIVQTPIPHPAHRISKNADYPKRWRTFRSTGRKEVLQQKHCHDSPWLLWALAHWTRWLVCQHSLTTKHAVVKLEKVQRKLEMHHVCLQSKSCAITLQHISKVPTFILKAK